MIADLSDTFREPAIESFSHRAELKSIIARLGETGILSEGVY